MITGHISNLHFANAGRQVDEEAIAVSILLKGKYVTAEQTAAARTKWQQIEQEVDRAALVPLEDALHHSANLDDETDFELAAITMERLAALPKPQRACLIESIFGNLSDEAIAASQGTTTAEVRFRIESGLTRLRAGLEEQQRQQG